MAELLPPNAGRPFQRRGPSGPRSAKSFGIVQVGYDQAIDTMLVPPPAGPAAFFPRSIDGKPLKVVLPKVVPGNLLEIDWRLNLEAGDPTNYPNGFVFEAIAMVTFDGSDPAFPSATTYFVVDSWGSTLFSDFDTGDGLIPDVESISALAAVTIPDGATTATVELLYISEGGFVTVGGTTNKQEDVNGLSATLKVWEIDFEIVTQAGPGLLTPAT